MNKIRRIHLLIVAVVLFVGLAVAFFMVLVKPRQKNIADWNQKISNRQKVADQLPQAQAALAEAQSKHGLLQSRWQQIMRSKMSSISLADPYRAIFAIYKEIPTYAPQMVAAFSQDKRVRLNSQFSFSQYGFTPPPTSLVGRDYPQSLNLTFKSFPDLLSWLRDTESLPRVLELGSNITITKVGTEINVSIPGVFHIYFAELPKAATPSTGVTTRPATGTGAPSRPTMAPGRMTMPMGPDNRRPGMGR